MGRLKGIGMKFALTFLLCLFTLLPGAAQDLPVLSPDGLEEFKLGATPPKESQFEGLTAQKIETTEWQEGEEYKLTLLKFYLNGHYLGKGRLEEGKLAEIPVVGPKVRYEGGFAVGSTWDEIQRVFPGPQLHFTYVSDRLFAASEYQDGVQVNFSKEDYVGSEELRGEFQNLKEEALKPEAKATSIRVYKP